MAGFFGLFDYTKEGPGVDPDEPQKGPILEFLTLYFRKFWKYIQLNLMFVLFNLPGILLSLIAAQVLLPSLFPSLSLQNLTKAIASMDLPLAEGITPEMVGGIYNVMFMIIMGLSLCALQFFVVGPSQAGLTYIFRNYARQDHAFLWMDFRDTFKANWKQGLATSALGSLLCFLMITAYYFYGQTVQGFFGTFLRTLIMVMLILLVFIQMYAYQMMITFDLPLKYIFKNGLLFAILRLPFNLLILILLLLINVGVPLVIAYFLGDVRALFIILFYFGLFAFSFSMFLINYFVNRQLQRFMIQPLLRQEEKKRAEEEARWLEEDLADDEDEEVPEEETNEDDETEDEVGDPGRLPDGAHA